MQREPFSTTCPDGVELKGILLIPEHPKAVIQFNCGTAAKKEFYIPFLEYFVENNYVCCLWDYRGSGDSAPKNLAKCDYYMHDYGTKDMPAIKKYLRQRFPDLKFLFMGHSAGGQQVGFVPELDDVHGMVGFAVSSGYTRDMPFYNFVLSNIFFWLITPVSLLFKGYLMSKPLGIMENLPKNVIKEWRAWCGKPSYFFDKKFYGKSVPKGRFQTLPFPIHHFWATDDAIASEKNVHNLWQHFHSEKSITHEEINPKAIDEKKIDHFGFFRRRMKEKIWVKALAVLDKMIAD
jgi:predicted alpha/beta hydrolase